MVNLTGIFQDVANAIPGKDELINQIIAGAAGTVVLSGLKSQSGQDAVDPLHLFHHDTNTSTVIGKSITAAAYGQLSDADKAAVRAAGYVIV